MTTCHGPKCDREVCARGLCLAHYKQMRKGNELVPLVKSAKSVAEKIRLGTIINPDTGCWVWQFSLSNTGYGRVTHEGRTIGVHVASVLVLRGEEVPPGHEVCHRCNNRACCNPDHLYVGTRADNVRDAMRAGTAFVPGGFKGEDHPLARLTEDDVRAIRASSERPKVVAQRFNVTHAHIYAIRKRKIWKHVA
jgi:HNH endonuclease